jgi:hypothetical protein
MEKQLEFPSRIQAFANVKRERGKKKKEGGGEGERVKEGEM